MPLRPLARLSLAVLALAGCRSDRADTAAADRPAATPAAEVATFTATDYAFAGPARLPAGTIAFRLVNRGKEIHHVTLVRLEEGKTFEDLLTALRQPGPPPAWIHAVGGPNAVDPGGESNATVTLTPGTYGALCFIPSLDGVPHLAKGMVAKLEVTSAAGPAAAEPEADIVMRLKDYDFELSAPLRAGPQTIRVENAGPQEHEVVLALLHSGKTAADLAAWEKSGLQGPPPASFVGGAAPLHQGERNTFSADLQPGNYLLICFIPDAQDGKPHAAHGMAKTVAVQ